MESRQSTVGKKLWLLTPHTSARLLSNKNNSAFDYGLHGKPRELWFQSCGPLRTYPRMGGRNEWKADNPQLGRNFGF